MYLALYREVTAPAPGNSRQTPIFNPTPLSLFVPQIERGVGFLCGFWNIWGAGAVGVGVWVGGSERGFSGGAEGQMRGRGEIERRVIDDDERGI